MWGFFKWHVSLVPLEISLQVILKEEVWNKHSCHLLSGLYETGTVISTLHVLSQRLFTLTPQVRYWYSNCISEKSKVQRSAKSRGKPPKVG